MNFISYAQLSRDINEWVKDLPRFDAVIGIERSGIIPATMLALCWNVPFFTLGQTIMGDCAPRGGGRLDKTRPLHNVLVIDDSHNSGAAMRRAKIALKVSQPFRKIHYAAVYVADRESAASLDYYFRVLARPRIFQWNVFHQEETMAAACLDLDGVICEDVPAGYNDDGPRYGAFLRNARPLCIPTVKIGAIVSCRLEKYRPATEDWLYRNKVNYGKLYLMPFATPEERRKYGHGQYKAEIYEQSRHRLFVENEIAQALRISQVTQRPVLHVNDLSEWSLI